MSELFKDLSDMSKISIKEPVILSRVSFPCNKCELLEKENQALKEELQAFIDRTSEIHYFFYEKNIQASKKLLESK